MPTGNQSGGQGAPLSQAFALGQNPSSTQVVVLNSDLRDMTQAMDPRGSWGNHGGANWVLEVCRLCDS